jgi:hypothetical protein
MTRCLSAADLHSVFTSGHDLLCAYFHQGLTVCAAHHAGESQEHGSLLFAHAPLA